MKWQSRHSILTILFAGYLLCYMDRMVIATALPFIAKDLQLSPLAMGGVLSAFFVGYAAMQIPGGLLADRLGPRLVLTFAIVGWSLFTFLTGAANTLTALLAIRVLFGMAEGPYPPAASKTVALWFSERDLGRANGIQLASVNIGAAIAPLLVAPAVIVWGWRSVFYLLLVPGLILSAAVWLIVKQPADEHGQAAQRALPAARVPLTQIFSLPGLLPCAATLFFGNMASWGLMNWLPTYLLQARSLDVLKAGGYASIPFLAGALGYFLGGYLSDRYFRDKRHVPIAAGFVASGCLTLVATIAPSGELAVAALVLVFFSFFVSLSGLFTLPLLLAPPQVAGSAFGVVNTVGQVAAFLSPLFIGYVLDISVNNFTYVFYILMALFFVAAAMATHIRVVRSIENPALPA